MLTEKDRAVIRALQKGLPLEEQPFAALARMAGVHESALLGKLAEWKRTGLLRRLGAFVRHRELGYSANGMVVWNAAEDRIEAAGRRLAREPGVSHCYERPAAPGFPYNLYCMIHGRSRAEVTDKVAALARELGINDYEILYSVRELKRSTPEFFVEDQS